MSALVKTLAAMAAHFEEALEEIAHRTAEQNEADPQWAARRARLALKVDSGAP